MGENRNLVLLIYQGKVVSDHNTSVKLHSAEFLIEIVNCRIGLVHYFISYIIKIQSFYISIMCIYTRRFPQFDACIMCTDALLASHFTQLIQEVNCLGFNTQFHPNFFSQEH